MENVQKKAHPRVLIVHSETKESIRAVCGLSKIGCIVQEAFGLKPALAMLKYPGYHDVVFVESKFRQGNPIEFAVAVRKYEASYGTKSFVVGLFNTLYERADMDASKAFDYVLMGPLEGHIAYFESVLVEKGGRSDVTQEESKFHEIQRLLGNGGGMGRQNSVFDFSVMYGSNNRSMSEFGDLGGGFSSSGGYDDGFGATSVADQLNTSAGTNNNFADTATTTKQQQPHTKISVELSRRLRIAEAEGAMLTKECEGLRKYKVLGEKELRRMWMIMESMEMRFLQQHDHDAE
eukprot:PhF_6_TR42695/c0_g1_i6/m.64441